MAIERGLFMHPSCIWRCVQIYGPELDKCCRRDFTGQTPNLSSLATSCVAQGNKKRPASAGGPPANAETDYNRRESTYVSASSSEVSRLLAAWAGGDRHAADELTPLIYGELKRLAAVHMRSECPGHTLQPTAVVHELFIRLAGQQHPRWEGRGHFFAIAGRLMRQILVYHARTRRAAKRDRGVEVSLDDINAACFGVSENILDIDRALTGLEDKDPRKAHIVEMRYFAGMQIDEIAEMLELSHATVYRDLRLAEAWLHRRLKGVTKRGP